jgi:hypothetical protein
LLLPLWLLWPGVWARFLLGVPISFLMAVFWPIGRAQLLASVPGRAGATTAVDSLLILIPLPLLFGLLAEALTLTTAMLLVTLAALPLLLLLVRRLPAGEAGPSSAPLPADENAEDEGDDGCQ